MNITNIQITSAQEKLTRSWLFRKGSGRLQNVYVISGEFADLDQVSKGMTFVLLGKKQADIEEVTVDFIDNSGSTWRLQRGRFGVRFFLNGKLIPIDQAQKTMLAALLDLDIGLNGVGDLAGPVLFRIFERIDNSFVSRDGLLSPTCGSQDRGPRELISLLAGECARLISKTEYLDAKKLSSIAESLISVQSRWTEAISVSQSVSLSQEFAPSLSMIETLSKELDHLQNIDFLCKKMGDVQDSLPRLASQLETVERRIDQIAQIWSPAALGVGLDLERWTKGIDLLVRSRGYARLSDTAARIRKICVDRVRPIAEAALSSWDEFLGGSRSTGEELESCMASMLLGMKQLGSELEKANEATLEPCISSKAPHTGWFDRLRGGSGGQIESARLQPKAFGLHQSWLNRAMQEIEGVKESLNYTLKSVQEFVDDSVASRAIASKGLAMLEELAQKADEELLRLSAEWKAWALAAELPEEMTIDALCTLSCEAAEFQSLSIQRDSLTARYQERQSMQSQLEALVRQWWKIIGSDKAVDITNPAFLVAEARAALRHRDTRRQRVHKVVKDAARRARDESLLQWAHKRKAEIQLLWSEIFMNAGLPPIEITDHRVPMVARLGCAIQAVERLQLLRAEASQVQADQWLEDEKAAVRVYMYSETELEEIHRNLFAEYANNCPVIHDLAVNIFLIGDEELAHRLQKNGFGTAIKVTSSEGHPLLLENMTPPPGVKNLAHRGGSSKDERPKGRAQQTSLPLVNSESTASKPSKPLMSSKAEAVLSILNPKSRDVNSR